MKTSYIRKVDCDLEGSCLKTSGKDGIEVSRLSYHEKRLSFLLIEVCVPSRSYRLYRKGNSTACYSYLCKRKDFIDGLKGAAVSISHQNINDYSAVYVIQIPRRPTKFVQIKYEMF